MIMQGNTARVFDKGEKTIQILLKAGFATWRSKIKRPAQITQFLGVKRQDGHYQIPMDMVTGRAAMSPQPSRRKHRFLCFLSGTVGF